MKISESFYSVQGEGPTTGVPSYFIRLQGCNLICGGHNASLQKAGKASWYCDTENVWRNGVEASNEELLFRIEKTGQLENVLNGTTHLIWTGGEPTLPRNQQAIEGFLDFVDKRYEGNNIWNELETNGTIDASINFYGGYMQQINCSPKLQNSGMPVNSRVNPDALKNIVNHNRGYFKFVVSNEDDVHEARTAYINPFDIPLTRVYLMPGVDTLKDLSERTRFVYEMAKKYNYRATTRGQVLAWDKTTGV